MKLLLSVLRHPDGEDEHGMSHVFDAKGGTIGRCESCDWSIPDKSKTLSSLHATVSHTARGFSITDTSTNGVYLNKADTPLGRNRTSILSDGDTLTLAGYVVSVTVLTGASAPRRMPVEGDRLRPLDGASEVEAFWSALGLDRTRMPPAARERMMTGLGVALREAMQVLADGWSEAALPADLATSVDRTIAGAVLDGAARRGSQIRSVTA